MDIPIDLKPGHTCKLEIHYPRVATKYGGDRDGEGIIVHYPTQRLIMEVALDRGRSLFWLKLGSKDGMSPFHVYDFSGNPMLDYEQRIESRSPPAIEGERLRWVIDNPLIGCNHCLFFRIHVRESF